MSTTTIKFEFDCDDPDCLECGSDDHHVVNLPAKNEVCPDCEGEGRTLNENLRGGFSSEEFAECFEDDESRAEYRKGGHGIYGVPCKTCKGNRVVPVVDAARCDPNLLKRHITSQREDREYERLCRAERAMGA